MCPAFRVPWRVFSRCTVVDRMRWIRVLLKCCLCWNRPAACSAQGNQKVLEKAVVPDVNILHQVVHAQAEGALSHSDLRGNSTNSRRLSISTRSSTASRATRGEVGHSFCQSRSCNDVTKKRTKEVGRLSSRSLWLGLILTSGHPAEGLWTHMCNAQSRHRCGKVECPQNRERAHTQGTQRRR